MEITVKTNGYTGAEWQTTIDCFNKAVSKMFPNSKVTHFYYGDNCDMVTLVLTGTHYYAEYVIVKNRVYLDGYTCTDDLLLKFRKLTLNDPFTHTLFNN